MFSSHIVSDTCSATLLGTFRVKRIDIEYGKRRLFGTRSKKVNNIIIESIIRTFTLIHSSGSYCKPFICSCVIRIIRVVDWGGRSGKKIVRV